MSVLSFITAGTFIGLYTESVRGGKIVEPVTSSNNDTVTVVYTDLVIVTDVKLQPVYPIIYGKLPFVFTAVNKLPPGLILDSGSGVITGVPNESSVQTTYVVNVSNFSGVIQTKINITVSATVPVVRNYKVYTLGDVKRINNSSTGTVNPGSMTFRDTDILPKLCVYTLSIGVNMGSFTPGDSQKWFSADRSVVGLGGSAPKEPHKGLQCAYVPAKGDTADKIRTGLVENYNKQQTVDNQYAINGPSLTARNDTVTENIFFDNPAGINGSTANGTHQTNDMFIYSIELKEVVTTDVPVINLPASGYLGCVNRLINSVNETQLTSLVYVANDR